MNTILNSIRSAVRNNSLILIGIIAFIAIIGFSASQNIKTQDSQAKDRTESEKEKDGHEQKKYIVKKGDYLWKIAENQYGSGYNAYDIAQANKLQKPYTLFTDQELLIPSVQPKFPTKGEISALQSPKKLEIETKYTIKRGDTLWSISQQFYGSGYLWTQIA